MRVADYVHWFARFQRWDPAQVRACRVGDLDDLWRDLLYPQYEHLTTED